MSDVRLMSLPGMPEVGEGDDLARLIWQAAGRAGWALQSGDVLVIAQKVVSKAEGRITRLQDVEPSQRAFELAREMNTDPRKVQVVLNDSAKVIRVRPPLGPHETGVIITETHSGFICANAGVDESNTGREGIAISLPEDPDKSARNIRRTLMELSGTDLGIIISDTFGRPWRIGETNVAIGLAGVPALVDLRGSHDRDGRVLKGSRPAFADEVAAASGLVSDKVAGIPVTLVRGLRFLPDDGSASDLIRSHQENLFH